MTEKREILEFAKRALHLVRINVPYLAELTHDIELIVTNEIGTAGIFASGRLIFNPDWFRKLSLEDATFVMAHEVMHLALSSHQRSSVKDHALFNITHDFIINELLKETFGLDKTPVQGLDWSEEYGRYYDLKDKSAEELMKFIQDALDKGLMDEGIFKKHWGLSTTSEAAEANTPLANQLIGLMPDLVKDRSDILDEKFEIELFPEITNRQVRDDQEVIKTKAAKALSARLLIESIDRYYSAEVSAEISVKKGGSSESIYEAITTLYQPPWEVALQKWIEGTQRSGKTYSRPSRRGQYSNFVRPGYLREGNTLHIIIDTSGSMAGILGKVLGIISSFCETMNIPEIHIIQCDTQVSEDRWYYLEELLNFRSSLINPAGRAKGTTLPGSRDPSPSVDKGATFSRLYVPPRPKVTHKKGKRKKVKRKKGTHQRFKRMKVTRVVTRVTRLRGTRSTWKSAQERSQQRRYTSLLKSGLGSSDMSPGLMRLAEDSQVEYALVITDGHIRYPQEKMPFEILWVLTEKTLFKPNYGTVVQLTDD